MTSRLIRRVKIPDCESILGEIMHSTTTVSSSIRLPRETSLEEAIVFPKLEVTEQVHEIKCDYGHKVWVSPSPASPASRSAGEQEKGEKAVKKRVGRKPGKKPQKVRKHPGNGESFHSQITFHVLGDYTRPAEPGDEGRKYCEVQKDGRTRIRKTYKVKLFRNGNVTVPGALTEDMSDVCVPLATLCQYLTRGYFAQMEGEHQGWQATYERPVAQMYNYKFRLEEKCINLYKFRAYCRDLYKGFIHVNPDDIRDFLLSPAFHDNVASPCSKGWRGYFNTKNVGYEGGFAVELEVPLPAYIVEFVMKSKHPKTVICARAYLEQQLAQVPLSKYYTRLCHLSYVFRDLSDAALMAVLHAWLDPHITVICQQLLEHDDNFLVGVRYEQESYAALLMRFRSLSSTNPEKMITVKIFPPQVRDKQKLNIDGAMNREEGTMVYRWLNYHLTRSKAIFEIDSYDTDNEFSYTSSDVSDVSDSSETPGTPNNEDEPDVVEFVPDEEDGDSDDA